MVKRRATDESDSSDVDSYLHSSTPSKRARVEESSDEDASPSKHAKKSKLKEVVQDEEDDEDALDAQISTNLSHVTPEQDDAEFEAEHESMVLDAMNSKRRKKKGSIASMGIIESIELHQFMCHPRLSFKFGPQINFIIGYNGSGKSAVLSGLTIALGGKANSTGRGNGLKSFIREGQSTAEVTISIKNQGDEAFKPDIYGKSIFITRRFTKEGSSSYKIKSADGKIISTKREELSAICDHMNIQVDNPMNILTQDSARQFLSASHPTDKYQFFLKGTQLTQLSEEYETCLENIGKTTRTLQLKREEIPDLEKAYKEAEARNNEANKAREKKTELAEYKRELAWAHVQKKEAEMTKRIEEVAKARRRLPRIETAITQAEVNIEAENKKVEEIEAESEARPSIKTIEDEREMLRAEIKRNADEIVECKANEKEMNRQKRALEIQVNEFDKEIAKETAKLQGDTQGELEEVQRRLQAAEKECEIAKQELNGIPDERQTIEMEVGHAKAEGKRCEEQRDRLRADIEAANSNIRQCQQSQGDNVSNFGHNLPALLNRIKNDRWAGEMPVGPFGAFVTLKDPKWADVMRTQLGQAMNSFAVTDNRDRRKLKQMLDQSGNQFAQIFVSDIDLFDYSRGEPSQDVLTVLRALEIRHEFIKRILINQRAIEKVVLADTRKEGDELLLRLGGGGFAWTCDGYIVRRYAEGGGTSSPMQKLPNNDSRQHMFTSTDRTSDIQRWENVRVQAETRLPDVMATGSACIQRFREGGTRLRAISQREKVLRDQVARLTSQIVRLKEEAIVEAPVGIRGLEQAKAEAIEEKRSIMEQFANVCERRLALDAVNAPLLQKRVSLDRQIAEWQSEHEAIKKKLEAAMGARVQSTHDKEHWDEKLADENANVTALQNVADVVQTEFEEWSAKAELIGTLFENPRKPEVVQRQIESVTKALQQHERQQGATPEEIAIECDNAKYSLDRHMHQLDEVSRLNKGDQLEQALKTSLALRMGKWVTFRQHIALRCKYQFQHHLWSRGYYGKVIFDHVAGTLNLKVQTDDQTSTQSKDKDPKSLSGGEKSYSTICLLLALWESIQCPVRCLDEFDVFMDSVNRRISMKMMVDTANTSDKQYILITPQDMSHVALGPTVRVHRMSDPERNQNQLGFS